MNAYYRAHEKKALFSKHVVYIFLYVRVQRLFRLQVAFASVGYLRVKDRCGMIQGFSVLPRSGSISEVRP